MHGSYTRQQIHGRWGLTSLRMLWSRLGAEQVDGGVSDGRRNRARLPHPVASRTYRALLVAGYRDKNGSRAVKFGYHFPRYR